MSVINELKKQYPDEFQRYDKKLLKQHIDGIRESLNILLSIRGVIPETDEGDNDD